MSQSKRFKVQQECVADITKCHFVERIIVAHHTEILLSNLNIDEMSDSLEVIAKQNNLDIVFYKEYTIEYVKVWVKYDITDMLKALDLFERSVLQN